MRTGKTRSVRKGLVNGILVLASIAAAVLITEVVLRFTPYAGLVGADPFPPRDYYVQDPVNGYDIADQCGKRPFRIKGGELEIWSNELGCFDEPYGGEEPFMLLVGDSFSWGYAPFEHLWGRVVEEKTGLRVLKCAVQGYGTADAMRKAEKVVNRLGKKPSVILLGYFLNDPIDDYLHPRNSIVEGYPLESKAIADLSSGSVIVKNMETLQQELRSWQQFGVPTPPRNPALKIVKKWLSENSALYRMMQPPILALLERSTSLRGMGTALVDEPSSRLAMGKLPYAEPGRYPWLDGARKENHSNLRKLKTWADQRGAKLLVVLIPAREQVYPFLSGQEDLDVTLPTRLMTDFLDREKVDYIDLLAAFVPVADRKPRRFLDPQRDLYWAMDSHWNARGSRLAGLLVARHLVDRNLVGVPDRHLRLQDIDRAIRAHIGAQ
jgi:hypothetical protein